MIDGLYMNNKKYEETLKEENPESGGMSLFRAMLIRSNQINEEYKQKTQ